MSKLRKALPFVLLAVVAIWTFSHQSPLLQTVHAQQTTTPYDCTFTFHFTSATANTPVPNNNASRPCVAWRVTYTTTGFSSVTVQFETSPDTTPADFTAVPNTGCSSSAQPPCFTDGASPITPGVQGTAAYRAYAKYVRVNVTSVTGSGTGDIVVYGYKGTSASAGIGSLANPGLFVPYTGANANVNLGSHSLTVGTTVYNADGTINFGVTHGIMLKRGTYPIFSDYQAATANGSNIFVGLYAANTTMDPAGMGGQYSSYNSIVGVASFEHNTTGYANSALGAVALQNNTSGAGNTAIGYNTLFNNTTGWHNNAFGDAALQSNTTAADNVAMGSNSLKDNITGSGNTALGFQAGVTDVGANTNVSGSNNVWLGYNSGPSGAAQLSNAIAVGYLAKSPASNTVQLGNSSVTEGYVGTRPIVVVAAKVDLTAQAAIINLTTAYAVPAGEGGMYRISCYVVLTQAATASSTLPGCGIKYTDLDTGVASPAPLILTTTSTANTVGTTGVTTYYGGQYVANVAQSTNIQYQLSGYVSVGATPMQYAVHLRVEKVE